MSKNSKKRSFKLKDTKDTNLNDYYTQSELMALPELNYMKTVDAIAFLKQNNVDALVLKPPFDQTKVWLKSKVNNLLDEKS
jgi:hypothetical protein